MEIGRCKGAKSGLNGCIVDAISNNMPVLHIFALLSLLCIYVCTLLQRMLVHPATYLAKNGIPQSNSLSDRHRTLLDLARNANTSNKESHAHTFQGDVRRDGKIPCMGIHTLKDGL
ncbi:hypothetical protein VTP01DRAFT_7166 [Rhizomucor pusillus]|uniref:uncharacterized protein n=1 Tax=Rhizomucor pusillus TaxID=4840 RepID=UPI00374449A5